MAARSAPAASANARTDFEVPKQAQRLICGRARTKREHDARYLDLLERDGNLLSRAIERPALDERARSKIRNGTYGVSGASMRRIPKHRSSMRRGEAINTLAEQNARLQIR
jgi:hypothetical protein